jgi:biotin carboxyl carrier protein
MINKTLIVILSLLVCMAIISACSNNQDQGEKSVRAVVPVTVASPRTGKMAEYTELMATSEVQVKAVIKSPVTGYVEKCAVSPGDKVLKGQSLFQVRTKESAALNKDSLGVLSGKGLISLNASIEGVVATIGHPLGDFVQEGDILCTLVVPSSLVFLLEVPFENKNMVRTGTDCMLILPDHSEVSAIVRSVLPSMSGASQTQRVVLQPRSFQVIPESLMATVKIVRNAKNDAVILPKSCILNDEIMKNFWVMKLINDTLAVKVTVQTGIKGRDSIEVVTPRFSATDRFLSSGNYGLGDTAVVRIIRKEQVK